MGGGVYSKVKGEPNQKSITGLINMNGIRNYSFSAVFTEFLILLKVCVTLQYKVTKTWPECCHLCPGVYCWPLNFLQRYSPLSSRHCAFVAIDSERVTVAFLWLIMNIHWSPVLTRFTALFWLLMAGARWNSCHLSAFCVHHAPCHVTSCICRVTVTCHLHFWQNVWACSSPKGRPEMTDIPSLES